MICDNCGHFNDEGANFCIKCAYPLSKINGAEDNIKPCEEENLKDANVQEVKQFFGLTCYSCGNKIEEDTTFCRFCGARLKGEEKPEPEVTNFKEEKKDASKNLVPYIVALIITILVCSGLIIFMIFTSNLTKNEKYGIEERETNITQTKDNQDEKEEKQDNIKEEDETPKEEEIEDMYNYPEPVYEKITASSFIPDRNGLKYSADMTIDNNYDTAWNEGAEGAGIGEWVEFSSWEKQYVTGINILNGYCKSETLYYENHRPRMIEIVFDDMSVERELYDVYNVYQNIEFAEPVESKSVRIIIKDIYRGTEYDDCCISEIGIY